MCRIETTQPLQAPTGRAVVFQRAVAADPERAIIGFGQRDHTATAVAIDRLEALAVPWTSA
jgi:hypothetical protein